MSHGKSYDHVVRNLWNSDNVASNQSSLLFPNTSKVSNNSPWQQFSASGYSSTSPPGTASSSSSPNSQYYSRSPDDLSVDSLISSLLQVVSAEDFAPNCDNRLLSPGSYSDNARCRDCTDVLCDACARSLHINVMGNNNSEASLMRPLSLNEISLHSPMMRHHSPNSRMPLYCEIHRDAQRFYCQTCSKPFCAECGLHLHVGHVTKQLVDMVETAGVQAAQVMNEVKMGIVTLQDDLELVQVAAECLEQKAREATNDVMMCMRRVQAALEAREKDLLGRIENSRITKFSALKVRDEGLRTGISRLSKAVENLQDSMDSSSLASNPLDLLISKDMASAEVFQIKQARQNILPPEESWISFTGAEGNALHAIANLGSIVINNPGPIGDRRTVRGRGGSSPQIFHGNNGQSQSLVPVSKMPSLIPIPRGHPIPGINHPVTVRTGRAGPHHAGLTRPIKLIGNDADARDNLCRPWGIACDKEGNIIVADRSNNRIQIYRQDGSFVRRFGSHGTGAGQFDRPAGVAVDAHKRIVVADKDNHRIQILTMEGLFLLSFGEKGCRYGQFNYPWDVAVNSECQIVVSDTRNHRVQLFSAEGIFLRKYGFEITPNMWKHFDSPRGVAFNPKGNVVVTDFNNHRIVVVDSDFLNGRILGCETVSGNKQFLRPQGLVIDDEGNIIVADSRNHRIQIFDSAGTLKWTFGSHGKGLDEMDRPSGIALTPDGRIAVVDFGNNRVMLI